MFAKGIGAQLETRATCWKFPAVREGSENAVDAPPRLLQPWKRYQLWLSNRGFVQCRICVGPESCAEPGYMHPASMSAPTKGCGELTSRRHFAQCKIERRLDLAASIPKRPHPYRWRLYRSRTNVQGDDTHQWHMLTDTVRSIVTIRVLEDPHSVRSACCRRAQDIPRDAGTIRLHVSRGPRSQSLHIAFLHSYPEPAALGTSSH